MLEVFIVAVAFIVLCVASYTDLKTHEVPDWITYGLMFFALAVRSMDAVLQQSALPLVSGLLGFGAYVAIGYTMYYSGQWGGGDSKLLMGLGALIGIPWPVESLPFLLNFFMNILVVGALYAMCWSIVLFWKHTSASLKVMRRERSKKPFMYTLIVALMISALCIVAIFLVDERVARLFLGILAIVAALLPYLYLYIKAVEQAAMIKKVSPDVLTEGDWIAKEVVISGKKICGPKDLGITKKQIAQLKKLFKQKKIKYVMLKEGIPFVPSFLIAYVVTLAFGNLLLMALL